MQSLPTGSIEVIAGPMFSGKSEELIRRLRRAVIARLGTRIFKHQADKRYSPHHVVSHSEWRLPSQAVKSGADILPLVDPFTCVIGIDEAHFFEDELIGVARTLADRGSRVIIAGLDLDYLGMPFGPMPELLAIAESVTKLHAVCIKCGRPAHFSQRLIPAAQRVVVGAADVYEARCRQCFIPGSLAPEGSTGAPPGLFGDSPNSTLSASTLGT